jgi:hypothetical protein
MSNDERVLNHLPEVFTRGQLMDVCSDFGISYGSANVLPQKLRYEGRIEQVERGRYRKVEGK